MATPSLQASRRLALRRRAIVEEDDDESLVQPDASQASPAPAKSPRRQSRRTTMNRSTTTPNTASKPKDLLADCVLSNAQLPSPHESEAPDPTSPSKRMSPRRQSKMAPRRSLRQSEAHSVIESRRPKTPDLTPTSSGALTEVTASALNEQRSRESPAKDISRVKPLDTVLEKPMDIVVRTRNLGLPRAEEPPGGRPRTVIRNLVLTNFKSYAGRQVVGPFHTSFSSIIGPNGSGKSNVIDSLLFVFGFRASKMRQGKISALIHNSAACPDLQFCEVEVHFEEILDQQSGSSEPVPDSRLVISRRAFKNNSSKYYLNGSESSFTAVTTLLRDKGVDLDHKRFLILQGEVESIAQMKPKAANEHDDGLLEYLEDIIGTSKYKKPIEESALEVEALNDTCVEKNTRVQHVEKEKDNLEAKRRKALAFLRDENELISKQSSLYQVYLDECADNVQVTEESIHEIHTRLQAETEAHKENSTEIKALEKTTKQGQTDFELMEKQLQSLLKDTAKSDKERVKLDEKKRFLTSKQKKLERTLQCSRLSQSESASDVQKFADDVVRNSAEIASLEDHLDKEMRELATIRENLKGKTQTYMDQIDERQKELEPWKQQIHEKESAIAIASSELEILQERASAGDVALQGMRMKARELQTVRSTKQQEHEQLKASRNDRMRQRQALQEDMVKFQQQEEALRLRLSSARQKADDARASLSKSQNQGNVLNSLHRLQESGRIEGFHGRLGNLGTIDSRYDIAISTACPSLENIVVDNVEIGQRCIEHLRKNNLGRANFILLDRLAQRDLSSVETPEGVPRLFDLVKPKDDIFRPAFFSVLQNTLVATDLDQANRIAYGARRWRVVTLDGQLIDVSGTMSGGGTRVARGGMSSKQVASTSKEEVARLDVDRDALEKEAQVLQDKLSQVESEEHEVAESLPNLEIELRKIALELASLDNASGDCEKRAAELQNASRQPEKEAGRIKSLGNKIQKLEQESKHLHAQSLGIEESIKTLQDKVMEIGGVKLRSQKAKVDGLREQIQTLTDESSNAEVAQTKASKDQMRHEKTRVQAERDLLALQSELEQHEGTYRLQAANAADAQKEIDSTQTQMEDKRETLEQMKKDLSDKQSHMNSMRAAAIELTNRLEEHQKSLAENSKRHKHWAEKVSKLALHSTVHEDGTEEAPSSLAQFTKDELADMSKEALKAEIAALEEKAQNAAVDLGVLEEYRRRVEEHSLRSADLSTAVEARDAAKKRCDDMRRLRLEGFMQGFATISMRLKEMYQMITMGGNAELELVDSLDPFAEGILFSVMPPKKSWKNISNLSGGEKTLSSLALVFALHHFKPTPLYVMDEIDAALDFRNVSIVANYIKERTKNAQFIVISLRNNMFELASRLVGIYKVNQMTRSVTIENRDYLRENAVRA